MTYPSPNLLNFNFRILIKSLQKFIPKCSTDNESSFFLEMAKGNNPHYLNQWCPSLLMHNSVTPFQYVRLLIGLQNSYVRKSLFLNDNKNICIDVILMYNVNMNLMSKFEITWFAIATEVKKIESQLWWPQIHVLPHCHGHSICWYDRLRL